MPEFEFGAKDLRACQRLVYAARIATAAETAGGHRVRRSGEGSEFLDYRRYVAGDDVRRIDWTVFARLRQPYIRVVQHESVLYVSLLVDASRSMAAGTPQSKAALACRLACALAYVALGSGDHVTAGVFAETLGPLASDLRGRAALQQVVALLHGAPLGGRTDLAAAVQAFCERSRHRGLVVLISDFLQPGGYQEPIRRLLAMRFRVLAVQVLDAVDWGEGLEGALRLRDSETGQETEIIANEQHITEYRRRLRAHAEGLDAYCCRRGQFYLYAPTREECARLVARGLRQRGLLR
jgi:uncharacterized protein (DUF58 family)